MCLDEAWKKVGTCGCDRPPMKLIGESEWSSVYEFPVMLYDAQDQTWRWVYPSDLDQVNDYANLVKNPSKTRLSDA